MLKMQPRSDFYHWLDRYEIRNFASKQVKIEGQWLEFGVFLGESIYFFASRTKKIYGFDSFQGLPEEWNAQNPKGKFALRRIPKMPHNVELVVGLFQETLPAFKKEKVAFLHMDADLYSSTIFVLEQLNDYIVPGTIIVFDEFFDKDHEEKAAKEWIEKYKRKTRTICRNELQLAMIIEE